MSKASDDSTLQSGESHTSTNEDRLTYCDVFTALSRAGLARDSSDIEQRIIGVFPNVSEFAEEQLAQHGWREELTRTAMRSGLDEFLRFDQTAFEDRLREVYLIVETETWTVVLRR